MSVFKDMGASKSFAEIDEIIKRDEKNDTDILRDNAEDEYYDEYADIGMKESDYC